MKVSKKTTSYLIAITLVYTGLVTLAGFSKIAGVPFNIVSSYLLNFSIEGAYLTIVLFLVALLRLLQEEKPIIRAFLVYLLSDTVIFLLRTFLFGTSVINGNMPLNFFAFFVTAYFIVYTMRVKHEGFSALFKSFGLIMLFSILFRTIGSVMYIQHYSGRSMLSYMVISELLVPIVVLIILYKTRGHLSKHTMPNIPIIETI
jgi:hypothetical protein